MNCCAASTPGSLRKLALIRATHESEAPVTVEMVIQTLAKNTKLAQESVHILAKKLKQERDCECETALASALITRKDVIPQETLQKLDLLIGKYL